MKIINVTPDMTVLPLGRLGENETMQFVFDVSDWLEEYPGGTIGLAHRLPHTRNDYACTITSEGDGKYSWTITSAELTTEGCGKCELILIKDSKVKKGKVYKTLIGEALDPDQDPPSVWQGYVTDVLHKKEDAEAYAVGKRSGTDVGETDPTYHNNAKYYSEQASGSASAAAGSATTAGGKAQDAEAYAIGKRGGTDVESTDPAYHNNSKYYAENCESLIEAATTTATTNATAAVLAAAEGVVDGYSKTSEAYAVGKRGGTDVGSSDPAYHNNSKYYSEQAATSATAAHTAQLAAEAAAAEEVSDWLAEHVDPETGYVIDNTLTVTGAAADAKKVGDEIGDLKSAVNNLLDIDFINLSDPTEKKYISDNVSVGDTVSLTPSVAGSTQWCYGIQNCNSGDVFYLTGLSGSAGRLWAFIDSNDKLISKYPTDGVSVSNLKVTAPSGASKLIVNFIGEGLAYKGKSFNDKVDEPASEGTNGQVLTTDGNGGRTWTTVQGGGGSVTVDDSLSTSSENPVQNKVITGVINSIAENGYYETGSGSGDVYFTMSVGMINKNGTNPVSQNIDSRNDTAYIIIEKENVPNVLYFDDTKFKANIVFIKNNYEIAETYTSWDTTSPLEFTEPGDWDSIGINARKLSGNVSQDELSAILYKKESGRTQIGNLATKEYVDNHRQEGHKCIYPDGFTSRIMPNIFYDGKYYTDVKPSDYIILGTGEVWVATNGNDTTGDGTENNPYATITKALTVSAVTIHIKEGTYTQGTHYATSCYFDGKNVIGHGMVILQNDSSGHYASASSNAYIENITFKHGHATSGPAFSATCTTSGKRVCFVKCTFRDGGTNGLGLEGTDAVLFECVAYGNKLDGLNYHARTLNGTTYIPNVLEIDCKAYNNGTDQSGSDSCNGSTAHDGVKIIRLNGEYYSCYGGVIAEIALANGEPTISVNYGVNAHESTGTGTYNASFWASINTKMYLYDCLCYGSTYDISAINDSLVVSRRLTTGRDVPSVNTGNSATVYQY